MRRKYWFIILLVAVYSFFFTLNNRAPVLAATYSHEAKKGDTLRKKTASSLILAAASGDDREGPTSLLDVSGLTNVNASGYLSYKKVKPWGQILATDSKRIILSAGDRIVIALGSGHTGKPGDQFATYQTSSLIRHPITRKRVGYALSFLARIILKEDAGKGLWSAAIIENFGPVRVGSPIIPFEPVSYCIQPRRMDMNLTVHIVAVKNLNQIIGHMSVVYLDRGYDDGVRRGNVFEVVKRRTVRAPMKTSLPDVALGHVLVLHTRPKTATAVVISMVEEFARGALLKNLDWEKTQEVVSDIPLCRSK